ncbi:MAG: 3-deoxy-D-manno-octulosonic acid transferase [Rubrivivax sp.]|nr:MAG: 3-deoxy-D-manno-octulosonic acid transferase [Rubrivivax sp.]
MKPLLALWLYALVLRLATPFYLRRVWTRGREEPDYRWHWWERLGLYGAAHRAGVSRYAVSASMPGARPVVWVHAVSLGETRAAAALIAALRTAVPGMRLLLTHSTATGRAEGVRLLQAEHGDLQTWLPYDTPGAVRRFLRLHRPAVGVLMETEVWPVLQHQARCAGVPMVLANARLSDKSLRQGLRFASLMQPAARALSLVLAQTQDDAARLTTLLAPDPSSPQKPVVRVCGNVKFDMRPSPSLLMLGQRWRDASERAVVLATSTREGEEAGLLDAWLAWGRTPRRPRLLIVPRHPQRFDEVAALVLARGLSLSRRSEWPADAPPDDVALSADVWLGDSMGEMPAYYAAAQVALLGGSFAPLGGQNLIEAAACGCAIVMGPSTFNFAEAAELSEQAGAARRVADWEEGVRTALAWMGEAAADQRAATCLAFARAHQGAAATMAEAIAAQL